MNIATCIRTLVPSNSAARLVKCVSNDDHILIIVYIITKSMRAL